MTPRRRRWPWFLLAAALALPAAALAAVFLLVDAEALRPRLGAAVESATGRRFTVGEIRLALSLRPTVELRDVALANAPGGSRPAMLTAQRVEVQAALLPLLSRRLEIARIELSEPDLLLETDAGGRGNWVFAPQAPAATTAPAPAEAAPRQPLALGIDRLLVERGRVTWRDARAGTAETLEIPALDAAAPLSGPATARGQVVLRGQAVALAAETGALSALGGAAPWPFRATLGAAGAEAVAQGSLAADGAWTARLEARAPDLARLAPLLPDMPLPPLRDLAASGSATGRGGEVAGATDLVLRIGASDLSVLRPGLALRRFEAVAPRLDAPLALSAEAALGGAPLRLSGTAGTPALLLGRAAGPLPVDLRLETTGAAATLAGRVADPRAVSGVDLALAGEAADLAALSPLAGVALPALRDLRLRARIRERTPGFAGGAHLRDLALASSAGEVAGELTLVVGERPGLVGRLAAPRIDLDAIRAAMPAPGPAPAQSPAQPPAAAAPPEPAARDGRVIPAAPLPVGALRILDAELDLSVAELVAGGQPWRRIAAKLGFEAGRARLAPVTAETPAGPVALELEADARQDPPAVRIAARSPGLDLGALQAALGQPPRVTGRAELEADLRGRGADTRAVAASLGGHLGLAMLDAVLEPPLVGPATAAIRQRLPLNLPQRLPVECVALRAEARDGIVGLPTLLLDAPAAKVAGSGTVNLRDETLAIRLLHDVRIAGTATRVGAEVGGTLADPRYRLGDVAAAAGAVAGLLGGAIGGDVGQALGAIAGRGARPDPLPDCGPALAAARGGRQGPVPVARPAEAAPAAQAVPAAPQPAPAQPAIPGLPPQLQGPAGDLLRGLLRR